MTWREYIQAHGQRPKSWLSLLRPTYWRRLNSERHATLRSFTHSAPCGHAVTTQFLSPDGQVLRQDVAIHVTRPPKAESLGGL